MVLTLEEIKSSIKNDRIEPALKLRLAVDAYRIHLKHLFDPLSCVATGRIDPLPHQIESFVKMMNMLRPHGDTEGRIRVLLADDVGLGKTIMIGMVLKELLLSSRVKNVLIVCPAGLQIQWQEELLYKFGENFEIVKGKVGLENPFKYINKAITSMDYAKNPEKLDFLKDTHWDLVIIDEAHKLKYGNQRFALGKVLSENCSHLILATATPHDGKLDNFLNILGLLDQNLEITDDRYELIRYLDPIMIRRMKNEITNFKGENIFPHREEPYTIDIDFTTEEEEFYNAVGAYVNKYYRKAEERNKTSAVLALYTLHRMVSSSIYAGLQALKNRRARLWEPFTETKDESIYFEHPEDLDAYTREIDDEKILGSTASLGDELKEEFEELNDLIKLGQQLIDLNMDSKGQKLIEGLKELNKIRPNDKIILFTEFKSTLFYLKEILEDESFNVVIIHGGIDIKERELQRDKFERFADILIGTDAISEGLNLQFANIVVNYELPWNPNRLEQRIGRAYRYGQEKPVYIYNYKTGFAIDNHVLDKLVEKLEEIRLAFGDRTVDVIGSLISEKDMMEIFKITRTIGDTDASDMVEGLIQEKLTLIDNIESYLIKNRFDLADVLKATRSLKDGVVKFDIERFILSYLSNRNNGYYDPIGKNTYIFYLNEVEHTPKPNCIENFPTYKNRIYDFQGTFDKETQRRFEYVALGNQALNMALENSMRFNGVSVFQGNEDGILLPYIVRFYDSFDKEVYAEPILVFKSKNDLKVLDPLQIWEYDTIEYKSIPKNIDSLIGSTNLDEIEINIGSQIQYINEFAKNKHEKELELDLKRVTADYECKIAIEERNIQKATDKGQRFLIPGHRDNINGLRTELQNIISELESSRNINFKLCGPLCSGIVIKSVEEKGSTSNEELKKKVEMAGVEYVIQHEERHKRTIIYNSLDKEEFRGYDIQSKADFEERLIEVKSFKSSGDIILSSNEWRVASENPDNFYLYVVFNALTNPELKKLKDPYNNLQEVASIIPKDDFIINIKPKDLKKVIDKKPPSLVVIPPPIHTTEEDKHSSLVESLEGEEFRTWMESLPFPLASILWSYRANKDANKRLEAILNFFEAFAEFHYTVLMSLLITAAQTNPDLFISDAESIVEKKENFKYWIKYPTLGSWIEQSNRLANIIRQIVHHKEKKIKFYEITGQGTDFINNISKKSILNNLREALKIRNDKSHKRCEGEKHKKCLKSAEDLLNQFWISNRNLFRDILMFYPLSGDQTPEGFIYPVKNLNGTNPNFLEDKIKSKFSLQSKNIYLMNASNHNPLKLQSFIRILTSKKTGEEAIYFYNKSDENNITWISYHYKPEPELNLSLDHQLRNSLILLLPKD